MWQMLKYEREGKGISSPGLDCHAFILPVQPFGLCIHFARVFVCAFILSWHSFCPCIHFICAFILYVHSLRFHIHFEFVTYKDFDNREVQNLV